MTNAIFLSAAGAVDLAKVREVVWEAVARALTDGGTHVLVLAADEGEDADVRREVIKMCATEDDVLAETVARYREGYADGYVDCLTIMNQRN